MHEFDIPPAECIENGEYNPPKSGAFYYFSKNGAKLREPRLFLQDVESKKKNYDDQPQMSNCTKDYGIGSSQSTYAFFFFCPIHGHCYGGHVITGSEGRRDAIQAMYCYLEKAPEVLEYDFSCSAEEYGMNREAGYLKFTQFKHDVFHGYNHTCSRAYKTVGDANYRHVNSSICEQFNSYMQRIKWSGRHMTQTHFIFFVQFMMHRWNLKKKAAVEDMMASLHL